VSGPLDALLRAARDDDRDAARAFLADRFPSRAGANEKLVALALLAAGDDDARRAIDAHKSEPEWSRHVPIETLEFTPLTGPRPDFSRTVAEELAASPFGLARLSALDDETPGAARALLDDLETIAREAARAATDVRALRASMRAHGLHAMQAAAFVRVQHLVDDGRVPKGAAALEIGAADGELVDGLAALGLAAAGTDVLASAHPRVAVSNFLVDPPPARFAVVVATALLEWGSGIDPAVLEDPARVLARLALLVDDGGALVLENVRLPLPFTRDDVARAGFTVHEDRVVSPTLFMGGRGVTLLRG